MNKTLIRITALVGAISIGTFGAFALDGKDGSKVASTEAHSGVFSEAGRMKGGKRFGKFDANGTIYTYTIDAESGEILTQDSKELTGGSTETSIDKTGRGGKSGKAEIDGGKEKPGTDASGNAPEADQNDAGDTASAAGKGRSKSERSEKSQETDATGNAPEPGSPASGNQGDAASSNAPETSRRGSASADGTEASAADPAQSADSESRKGRGGKDRSDMVEQDTGLGREAVTEIALNAAGVSADQAQVRARLTKDGDKAVYMVTVFVPVDA